jgi:hypothetical protein
MGIEKKKEEAKNLTHSTLIVVSRHPIFPPFSSL